MARKIQTSTTDTERLDTNIYNPITDSSVVPVVPSFDSTSTKVAGIVKLVNMFIKLMYTLKGTNYLNKDEGTYFINIFNYNIQDVEVAESKVQDAIDDAYEQITEVQAALGVPDTEKLRQVTIANISISDDGVLETEINIVVVSGQETTVQLPSTTLD